MRIGGLQKFSMIDYPGKLCAIVFTQGCNFRCPYCHNPELVSFDQFGPQIPEEEIFEFLKNRVGKLDAVSITGGEPTLHKGLPQFMRKLKEMGFLVKLDSNGTDPEMLEKVISEKLVDYIAMDIKAPFEKYEWVVRQKVDLDKIKRSIKLIKSSGIDYEFRTTLVKGLSSIEDVKKMSRMLGDAKRYFLQNFVSVKTLDQEFLNFDSFESGHLESLISEFSGDLVEFKVR